MNIDIIAEGSRRWQRFMRVWGLSLVIDGDVLFDTFGNSLLFRWALFRKGVSVREIRHIIISHEHWDHIAGLRYILSRSPEARLYICAHSSREFKDGLAGLGNRIIEVSGESVEIKPGVWVSREIKCLYRDEVLYEQSLILDRGASGLTLLTGCGHPGIINIVDTVNADFGGTVTAVIGGLHLKSASPDTVESVFKELGERGVSSIRPLHCSGKEAAAKALPVNSAGF